LEFGRQRSLLFLCDENQMTYKLDPEKPYTLEDIIFEKIASEIKADMDKHLLDVLYNNTQENSQ